MKRHLALLIAAMASACPAQTASPAPAPTPATVSEVSFQFERPGLQVPKYTIVVHEDGTGTYKGEEAPVSGGSTAMGVRGTSPGRTIDRPMKFAPSTADTIFKTARSLDFFNITCPSKAKNVADTGKKTLNYNGPDGHGSCTYNYSENKSVTQLTEMFQAIAFTMDEGRKLDFLHKYDRLGLYSEMDTLIHEVEEKRAMELENITPALTSIVADEALMQRVREKAARLLAQTETTTTSGKGH